MFSVDMEGALKRVPDGFPSDSQWEKYLRLKTFCLVAEPDTKFMTAKDVIERSLELFRTTQPFLEYINRAIEFVKNPV